ncbi:hypothetical protein C8Q75DRAFT_804939 [Abortiporus biennis]|nr:hypothetical protein C8Q75DRAFT_804939 [Abortiporus biennis]
MGTKTPCSNVTLGTCVGCATNCGTPMAANTACAFMLCKSCCLVAAIAAIEGGTPCEKFCTVACHKPPAQPPMHSVAHPVTPPFPTTSSSTTASMPPITNAITALSSLATSISLIQQQLNHFLLGGAATTSKNLAVPLQSSWQKVMSDDFIADNNIRHANTSAVAVTIWFKPYTASCIISLKLSAYRIFTASKHPELAEFFVPKDSTLPFEAALLQIYDFVKHQWYTIHTSVSYSLLHGPGKLLLCPLLNEFSDPMSLEEDSNVSAILSTPQKKHIYFKVDDSHPHQPFKFIRRSSSSPTPISHQITSSPGPYELDNGIAEFCVHSEPIQKMDIPLEIPNSHPIMMFASRKPAEDPVNSSVSLKQVKKWKHPSASLKIHSHVVSVPAIQAPRGREDNNKLGDSEGGLCAGAVDLKAKEVQHPVENISVEKAADVTHTHIKPDSMKHIVDLAHCNISDTSSKQVSFLQSLNDATSTTHNVDVTPLTIDDSNFLPIDSFNYSYNLLFGAQSVGMDVSGWFDPTFLNSINEEYLVNS